MSRVSTCRAGSPNPASVDCFATCEAGFGASAKYFKESELWVKTKLPVAVVVTDNVLPKDEFKVEKVDRRRKLEEE